MAKLFGKTWKRDELQRLAGSVPQLGGIERLELADGKERGVRVARFRTGTGFCFDVSIDRGMDIPNATYRGGSLCWCSPAGQVAPSYYERKGLGWLRGFFGGLLTTCGLTHAGAPCEDRGEELGLHGPYSYLPAELLAVLGQWVGDNYVLSIRGRMREYRLFGENLTLTRNISARLGENRFTIRDEVVNEGFDRSPLMVLYHFNLGFPLLAAGSRLFTPAKDVKPRDDVAAPGLGEHDTFPGPQPGYKEQCFFHDMAADGEGKVTAMLVAPEELAAAGGIARGFYVEYSLAQLPRFIEWKMVGEGAYVLGMEPANCLVMGRDRDREEGRLQFIEPGESRVFEIEAGVLTTAEDVAKMSKKIAAAKSGKGAAGKSAGGKGRGRSAGRK